MHHLTKKSAVEKHFSIPYNSKEELVAGLKADEKDFSGEDIEEIIAAIDLKAKELSGGPEGKTPEPTKKTQAEELGLSQFDYKNLQGESFTKYEDMVKTLLLSRQYNFECYAAEPIKKDRYPGLPQSPVDIVGVRIKLDAPLHTTRIEAKHAIELNKQLGNSGRYYLLKK